MRKKMVFYLGMCMAVVAAMHFQSCTKSGAPSGALTGTGTNVSTSSVIAVSADSAGTDSVYIIQPCAAGYYRDSIAASAVPSTAIAFADSNYAGYSFINAYQIRDSTGTIGGYVLLVRYDGKPVGLLFDAGGNFVRVLEQRERGDMNGPGWHRGGRYGNRDGRHADSVSLTALPSPITSYLSANYPGDTLVRAYRDVDSGYLVITQDNVLYANLFSTAGTFEKRVSLYHDQHVVAAVTDSELPAAIVSYLNNTYPAYVLDNGYAFVYDQSIQGYIVVIDANNTKYALEFDASGNFLAAITIA